MNNVKVIHCIGFRSIGHDNTALAVQSRKVPSQNDRAVFQFQHIPQSVKHHSYFEVKIISSTSMYPILAIGFAPAKYCFGMVKILFYLLIF
jgi:hypothetical protein